MTLWYLARAAGIMALAMLTLATTLGALGSSRKPRARLRAIERRVVVQRVHVAAAVTGLSLIVVHLGALLLDAQAGVSLSTVLVPMSSAYRPVAVSAGVLALYTVAFAAVVGSLRGRLAASAAVARRWRVLHVTAYAAWLLAMGHGFFAGTDTATAWMALFYPGALALVGIALAVRLWSQAAHADDPLTAARRRPLVRSTR